jgi:hypothetical protein
VFASQFATLLFHRVSTIVLDTSVDSNGDLTVCRSCSSCNSVIGRSTMHNCICKFSRQYKNRIFNSALSIWERSPMVTRFDGPIATALAVLPPYGLHTNRPHIPVFGIQVSSQSYSRYSSRYTYMSYTPD